MWDQFWHFIMDKHIFHAAIVITIAYAIFFPGRIKKTFGRFKKIKAGVTGFELDAGEDDISPETPCPYTKSHKANYAAIHNVSAKVDNLENKFGGLEKEFRRVTEMLTSMILDQQKQLFYNSNQPDAERLAGGLKYIFMGGNGYSKKDVIEFAEAHKDIYNALTKIKPEFRLRFEQS